MRCLVSYYVCIDIRSSLRSYSDCGLKSEKKEHNILEQNLMSWRDICIEVWLLNRVYFAEFVILVFTALE
jgi:hypothetical protein